MEYDPDDEYMEDVKLDYEIYHRCRMVSKDNDVGVYDKKALLHAKRWDVYVNKKEHLIKGGYLVKKFGSDGEKVIWEVVDNHVVEEETYHDEIGLQGFDYNLFEED